MDKGKILKNLFAQKKYTEVIDALETVYCGLFEEMLNFRNVSEEYKNLTTLEYSLVINNDNTATITMKYNKNMNEELVTEKDNYKYDNQYFYATKESIKDKKIYSYVFENGQIKLTVIEDTHGTVYTYTK